ncbi:hypothetical protein [Leptospira vanthielii]|nr:hypothetical protein [Leptospira vanthielii]
MKKILVLISILVTLGACKLKDSVSSGTLENPDMESNLSSDLVEFQPYLDTSNKIVDLVAENKFKSIVIDYFPPFEGKEEFIKNFIKVKQTISNNYGKFTSYKKKQWSFTRKIEDEVKIIQSIKIIHFNKSKAYLYLDFQEGVPGKIISFYIDDPPAPKKIIKLNTSTTTEYNK